MNKASLVATLIGTVVLASIAACLWLFSGGNELAILRAHQGVVRALAFSPDGSVLASGGDDKSVCLWNPEKNNLIRTLDGNSGRITSLAFAPRREDLLACAASDGTVSFWNWKTGQRVTNFKAAKKSVHGIAFAPRDLILASSGEDASIQIWENSDAKPLQLLRGHTKAVLSVTFSPDGGCLASAGEDGKILLWDWAQGNPIGTISVGRRIHALAFSKSGKKLAATVTGLGVCLWPFPADQEEKTVFEKAGASRGVAFSPDERLLASTHEDGTVKIFDVGQARLLCELQGHSQVVMAVAFSPDGKTVLTAGSDRTIRRWAVPAS